jgi:hypothetical protein
VDRALDRQRREAIDWQAARILGAARQLGISPDQVTPGDILVCVLDGTVPGEDSVPVPALRVDRRYGPRSRRQLAVRAARQAQRNAARAAS